MRPIYFSFLISFFFGSPSFAKDVAIHSGNDEVSNPVLIGNTIAVTTLTVPDGAPLKADIEFYDLNGKFMTSTPMPPYLAGLCPSPVMALPTNEFIALDGGSNGGYATTSYFFDANGNPLRKVKLPDAGFTDGPWLLPNHRMLYQVTVSDDTPIGSFLFTGLDGTVLNALKNPDTDFWHDPVFLPDGSFLVITEPMDPNTDQRGVLKFDTTGRLIWKSHFVQHVVNGLTVSNDGSFVVQGDTKLFFFDPTGRQLSTLSAQYPDIWGADSKGRWVVTVSDNGGSQLDYFDQSGKLLQSLPLNYRVDALGFFTSGKLGLTAVTDGGSDAIFDFVILTADGNELRRIPTGESPYSHMSDRHDGLKQRARPQAPASYLWSSPLNAQNFSVFLFDDAGDILFSDLGGSEWDPGSFPTYRNGYAYVSWTRSEGNGSAKLEIEPLSVPDGARTVAK